MKTAAIIAEYNPFHNGHEYQILETKELLGVTHIVALMSGNFVQRGMPAVIDKYRRAEMAVLGGVDLVLELPVIYALSSAEFFAKGAVDILNRLHGVDYLSFGSEIGDMDTLNKISEIVTYETDDYREKLKAELAHGISFPRARARVLKARLPELDESTLDSPNNILGVEYLKALKRSGSTITPLTVKRAGAGYHDEETKDTLPSASGIRKIISQEKRIIDLMPGYTEEYMNRLMTSDYDFVFLEKVKDLLYYRLVTEGDRLKILPEASEGLDHRILNNLSVLREKGIFEFLDLIKTKRYTHTRISRLLIQFLLGFDNHDLAALRSTPVPKVKILAANAKGNEILASIRKKTEIRVAHNYEKELDEFEVLDTKASMIYSLLNKDYDPSADYKGFFTEMTTLR